MEDILGAPMFRAVITSKTVTGSAVLLKVRYHRKNIFCEKRPEFDVRVGCGSSSWEYEKYREAKTLLPGDEFYVDGYGQDWCEIIHHNPIRKLLNLWFV